MGLEHKREFSLEKKNVQRGDKEEAKILHSGISAFKSLSEGSNIFKNAKKDGSGVRVVARRELQP